MRAQIAEAGVQVDVDAPKGQDLAFIMEEMRAKYERIALKNQEELKTWHESQVQDISAGKTQLSEILFVFTILKHYMYFICYSDHRGAGPGH